MLGKREPKTDSNHCWGKKRRKRNQALESLPIYFLALEAWGSPLWVLIISERRLWPHSEKPRLPAKLGRLSLAEIFTSVNGLKLITYTQLSNNKLVKTVINAAMLYGLWRVYWAWRNLWWSVSKRFQNPPYHLALMVLFQAKTSRLLVSSNFFHIIYKDVWQQAQQNCSGCRIAYQHGRQHRLDCEKSSQRNLQCWPQQQCDELR